MQCFWTSLLHICVLSFSSFHHEKYFYLQFVCQIELISKMLDRIQVLELFSLVKLFMKCSVDQSALYNSSLQVNKPNQKIKIKLFVQKSFWIRQIIIFEPSSSSYLYLPGCGWCTTITIICLDWWFRIKKDSIGLTSLRRIPIKHWFCITSLDPQYYWREYSHTLWS